jgi:CHAP domain/Putative peptidoglycan binding domain
MSSTKATQATKAASRILHLTSPMMHGPDVKDLQTLLLKFKYYHGELDGEFGPLTAQAVYRAKYWLGYPVKNCSQTAKTDGLLVNILRGDVKPTAAMNKLAGSRKAKALKKPVCEKMFTEATKWLGTKESPAGSNNVLFSRWYGIRGPWCAMFVTYCGVKVGSKAFIKPPTGAWGAGRYAYVPYVRNAAMAGRDFLVATTKPVRGDLVLFDWDNDGVADHIGFFEKWLTPNTFSTIEGNTGWSNQSNGGEVQHRVPPHERNKSNVQMFVHVTE